MSVIQTSQDTLRVELGEETVEAIIGYSSEKYKRHEMIYKVCSEQRPTYKQKPELVVHRVLPYAGTTVEGALRASPNKMPQLWVTNLFMQYYESNYIVTWQALQSLSKAQKVKKILEGTTERAMALAMKKDRAFAIMLNNYDSSSQTYGDGTSIGSTVQPTGDGTTFSNLAASAADINEESVEAAIKVIEQWTDTGGKAIQPRAQRLIIGTDLRFDAERLLQTEYKQGSNFNDVNVIKSGKYLPKGYECSPHLANDGSWFIQTDIEDGLVTYTFTEPKFDMRPLPQSWNTEFVSMDGYVHGIGDKRSIYVYPRS